jgi:arsenite methyltransferase
MIGPLDTENTKEIKACCAAAYQSDAVSLILGENYHPGGTRLTRRLADRIGLRPGQRVLDVASGPGGTALLLARDYGVSVDGVELGEQAVAKARAVADGARLGDRVRFHIGDAERLPFADAQFDAVICECAFCTFPHKQAAAAEIARVLRPGGTAGITDVTVAAGRLDDVLTGLGGWIACLADARPADDYRLILAAAGLRTTVTEHHNDAMAAMVDRIDARLRALRMVRRRDAVLSGIDFDTALRMTALARTAVRRGSIGYALLVAEKHRHVP